MTFTFTFTFTFTLLLYMYRNCTHPGITLKVYIQHDFYHHPSNTQFHQFPPYNRSKMAFVDHLLSNPQKYWSRVCGSQYLYG